MSDDVLVRVAGVSKKFCRDLKRSLWYGVQDTVDDLLGHDNSHNLRLRRDEFWAVDDVSFEVRRGEFIGLIGRNGAGKTTLLKMLSGLIKPDRGRIELRGRVGALIALGAGFNPILSGRENIYVNGSVLGLSKKEIDTKFDEIVDFAEIGEFIDAPVQSYSSGMQVRLGFAVATALEPDILLLDEVLAVGDLPFRIKCYNKMASIRQSAALIFVSHHMPHVSQMCDATLLLEKGRTQHLGDVSRGVQLYEASSESIPNEEAAFGSCTVHPPITDLSVLLPKKEFQHGDCLNVQIAVTANCATADILMRVIIGSVENNTLAEWNTHALKQKINFHKGVNVLDVDLGPVYLRSGSYYIDVVVYDSTRVRNLVNCHQLHHFTVSGGIRVPSQFLIGKPLS